MLCTVDEQLVGFRGRCPFRMYLPSKPDRYGIKIWWLTDTASAYAFNPQVDLGREGITAEIGLSQRVVMTLTRPVYESGRNITMDNYFTSVSLARSLTQNGLTLLGTLRANKAEIPPHFLKSNDREISLLYLVSTAT
jgi:hypothetical protein